MTAIVSQERARTTAATGVAGLLLIVAAVVMMVAAAPAHYRPHGSVLITDVCHQLTSRSDSTTVRACLAGPSAPTAWTDAYTPSMSSRSWSASSPDPAS